MFTLSKALLLAALVATGVTANPIALASDSVTPCSTVKCDAGTECKLVDGKAKCVPTGPIKCGNAICAEGMECCNESCSLCVKPGMMCTAHICPPRPIGEICGNTVCAEGLVCCNSSCGICAPPDGACITQWCGEVKP